MKAYKVTVNGNVYEITLEIIDKEDIKTTGELTDDAKLYPQIVGKVKVSITAQ